MPELLGQVMPLIDQATTRVGDFSSVLGALGDYIVKHFGETGLNATYIALAGVTLFVLSHLAKLLFSMVKYLVIPALALAFLASIVSPYSFAAALPVSVTVCSLFLLFKG